MGLLLKLGQNNLWKNHNVLISTFALPFLGLPDVSAANVTAQRVQHSKHKVCGLKKAL